MDLFQRCLCLLTTTITRLRRATLQSVKNVPPQLGCILSLCHSWLPAKSPSGSSLGEWSRSDGKRRTVGQQLHQPIDQ